MILSIIILSISLILDGLLSNYLPFTIGNLSFFTPLLTMTSILFIYPLLNKNKKNYFILIVIFGIIYDLSYTNLLFYNSILFLLVAFFTIKIYELLPVNFLSITIYLILLIIIYETLNILFIIIFQVRNVVFKDYYYKVSHSILLNILYGLGLYFLLYKRIQKQSKFNFR